QARRTAPVALRLVMPQPHRREHALDRVGRADVNPVLRREVIERVLEKPGIAWADQQPVRQPVRRCGFRELRPPPGRAELEATIADLEGQIAGSTKPKPVEAGGVPASLRPQGRGPESLLRGDRVPRLLP